MALKNQNILSVLVITLSLVLIGETGSAKRPFNCYFCDAVALSYLPSGPELQTCEFEDYIEINKQRNKFHLTYDKYDQQRHSKLENSKSCQKVSGYDEFGNFEIVRQCYDRQMNCTGFFYVDGERKNVRFSPFVVCESDINECINASNNRSDSLTGQSGTVFIWTSLLLCTGIFSIFNASV